MGLVVGTCPSPGRWNRRCWLATQSPRPTKNAVRTRARGWSIAIDASIDRAWVVVVASSRRRSRTAGDHDHRVYFVFPLDKSRLAIGHPNQNTRMEVAGSVDPFDPHGSTTMTTMTPRWDDPDDAESGERLVVASSREASHYHSVVDDSVVEDRVEYDDEWNRDKTDATGRQ